MIMEHNVSQVWWTETDVSTCFWPAFGHLGYTYDGSPSHSFSGKVYGLWKKISLNAGSFFVLFCNNQGQR